MQLLLNHSAHSEDLEQLPIYFTTVVLTQTPQNRKSPVPYYAGIAQT